MKSTCSWPFLLPLLAAGLLGSFVSGVDAQVDALTVEARFDRANAAYFQGDFDGAVDAYEELARAGVDDADVYYNLGSAYAEQQEYGRAIGNFERTLFLEPSDAHAEAALTSARDVLTRRQARANTEVMIDTGAPFGEALVRPFSERFLAYSFLALELLFFLAAGALVYFGFFHVGSANKRRQKGRLGLAFTSLALLSALMLTGSGVLIKNGWFNEGQAAVVVSAAEDLREGPDPRATSRGSLLEGERARILSRDGDYVRIRVSSSSGAPAGPSAGRDREGWVNSDQVLTIARTH